MGRIFLVVCSQFLLFATAFCQDKIPKDTLGAKMLSEVVVTATRQAESLLSAPVSIEKMDAAQLRASPQPGFFEAIQNIKGLHIITPGMGFKVINARGFANTTNVRFVQMVDGVDIQAPHIGAPIANSLGPGDLDINNLEILPGSASAIYGMNAINGTANFITKDPFRFPGISISKKLGVNNAGSTETAATLYSETNIRIARPFSQKWAIKLNGTFMKGTDWYANSQVDLNAAANSSTALTGELNPGKDRVNNYGDEAGNRKTLNLGGKQYAVSRTGYAEKDVADYDLQNIKGDASIYFRPVAAAEFVYTYRISNQNNIYQRTNRFRLHNYLTQQHALSFKWSGLQVRTYFTKENSGDSYNIRSMAENMDRRFKNDESWFTDFSSRYNMVSQAGSSVAEALSLARLFADSGRIQVGSKEMQNMIDTLRHINNWDEGAALKVKAALFFIELQHDITNRIFNNVKGLHIMYGLDHRNYIITPDGNYFINPEKTGRNLKYWKLGGFLQATKYFMGDKLKINAVVRIDKSEYFSPKIHPRLAIVYSPALHHSFRVSVQNGYRFPSIFEAFSNINSGGRKRIGGLPVMSDGVFESSYTQASITAFQKAVQNEVNLNGSSLDDAIVKNRDLLKRNPYTYLRPEKVTGFEAGYRTMLFNNRLKIDADIYYNIYRQLMAQIDANVPKTSIADSIPFYLQNNGKQSLYRLWTNSKTVSHNYGAAFGLAYEPVNGFQLSGNFTYAKLARKDQGDGLEDGFNTPKWSYNLGAGHSKIYKTAGFAISYRQHSSFLWESALATGNVPGYSSLDVQANVGLFNNALNIKIGATNVINKYYYSFIGGPSIGGFYYTNMVYSF